MVSTLHALGVAHVFGLPGSQNVSIFEALRQSPLRTVVATHELAASFMANGYARACGCPGVLITIPGPGFTYAVTGLAEAWLDSAPVVHIVGRPASGPGARYQLQAIDQAAMCTPVTKAVIAADHARDIPGAITQAYRLALAGDPGPVVVEIEGSALIGPCEPAPELPTTPSMNTVPDPGLVEAITALVAASPRVLIYAGQGALDDPSALLQLAQTLGAAVATTTSARGVVPEDHPLVVACDGRTGRLNALASRADLVLALGVKFSHNGAHGFRLALDQARLVHVDASAASLNGHYPARIAAACDVAALVRALTAAISPGTARQGWAVSELQAFRRSNLSQAEPVVPAAQPASAAGFFGALREALPPDSLLVTDSGLHQMLARRHFKVLAPRTLIVPTNFQSMGFALPAAIGAKLAHPARQVVALIGDGGLAMSGMELLTAVRERVTLTAVGIIDGHYGLIRQQQLGQYGHAHGTTLRNPDYARWAASLGAGHILYDGRDSLRTALKAPQPTLLEVPVRDSLAMRINTVKAKARAALKIRLGPEIVA